MKQLPKQHFWISLLKASIMYDACLSAKPCETEVDVKLVLVRGLNNSYLFLLLINQLRFWFHNHGTWLHPTACSVLMLKLYDIKTSLRNFLYVILNSWYNNNIIGQFKGKVQFVSLIQITAIKLKQWLICKSRTFYIQLKHQPSL